MRMVIPLLLVVLGSSLLRAEEKRVDSLGDSLPAGATQRLGTSRMKTWLRDLCYLADRRAVTLSSGYVYFWDLDKGIVQESVKVSDGSVMSVVPHPQRKVLLLTDSNGKVFEWDWEQKKEVRGWNTGQAGLLYACYSPDLKRVLTSGNPPTIKEWDLESGKQLVEIKGEMVATRWGAIYGPGGKSAVLGGGYQHNLEHYDLATGKLLHKWCTIYEAKQVLLSPDEKCVAVGVEDRAMEWSLADYKEFRTYKFVPGEAGRIYALAYLPKANEVLCGGRDGTMIRWSRETGKSVFHWTPHDSTILRLCISEDEKWVLSWGGSLLIETNLATGEPRLTFDRHLGTVEAAAFLPSANRVVSGSSDATLRVWDAESGKTVQVINGARLGAYALDVSPDGSRVAAGCKDGVVREFAVADGKLLRELTGHLGYVRAVGYTHDGSRLLSSACDGSIRVWALDKAEPIAVLQGHRGGVLALDISPDDKRILSGGRDGTVRLWDLAEGKALQTNQGHRGWVECVRFLPDGAHALSAGRDGCIRRWDLSAGKAISELQHGIWTYALAISPDGSRVFSAGQDRAISCWDLKTGRKTGSLNGHQSNVQALAVSPNGKRLVSGSDDSTLLVWDLP